MCLNVLFAQAPHTCNACGGQKGCQLLWKWSYRVVRDYMGAGDHAWVSRRTASTLNL